MGSGMHRITLDGERRLPAGVYMGRLTQGGRAVTARVSLGR